MILPNRPPDDDKGKGDPLSDKERDPFKPPADPIEVGCLHCGCIFMSSQMVWRVKTNLDGESHGFWCCPDATCDGAGFGFDLLPTDPTYRDEYRGWSDDDEDDELYDDDELDLPDPAGESFDPPRDWTGNDDEDDIPF